jgi:type II secretory pathway pseudopilin PulG
MTRIEKDPSQAGFTLVEAMIAMFFVAFMVAEMGTVMSYASRNTNFSQRITRANSLADEAIEKSRNTAYENIQFPIGALGEACTSSGGNAVACTSTLDGGRFARVRTVTPRNSSLPPGTTTLEASQKVDVDVTISFTDARGTPHAIRVASIISRH